MGSPSDSSLRTLLDALKGVLGRSSEPAIVLEAILDQAVAATGADRGLIVEIAEDGSAGFEVLHQIDARERAGDAGRFSRRLCAQVLEFGTEIVLENALDHPFYGDLASVQAMRARAIVCAPVRAGGRIAAVIQLESREAARFEREHVAVLLSLVELAGPVLGALHAAREVMAERDRLSDSEKRYRVEAEESRRQLASEWSFARFAGQSAPVRELEAAVRRAAASEFPVLVTGETGTGKSIIARFLHHCGPRARGPLVTVFCPSLEKGMVESELFGHRRGAFTGADRDRLGKVPAAERGTLFIDEIGELPADIQPKLLRLLAEHTYEVLGDTKEMSSGARIVAATNRDLEVEVAAGRFRRDLLERLRFIPIRIPPLRERTADLPLLLRYCLDQTERGRWIEIAPGANEYLVQLDFVWPGNVRHLEQLAARLTLEAPRRAVTAEDIARLLDTPDPSRAAPAEVQRAAAASSAAPGDEGLPRFLEEQERRYLEQMLERYAVLTRTELAARLGISESALYKKLRRYGL